MWGPKLLYIQLIIYTGKGKRARKTRKKQPKPKLVKGHVIGGGMGAGGWLGVGLAATEKEMPVNVAVANILRLHRRWHRRRRFLHNWLNDWPYNEQTAFKLFASAACHARNAPPWARPDPEPDPEPESEPESEPEPEPKPHATPRAAAVKNVNVNLRR